jgi:futalosine hydrolase
MGRSALLAVAAPAEARAVLAGVGLPADAAGQAWVVHALGHGLEMVVTGVGKSNAAGAVARVLDPARHWCVVSAGLAGALPAKEGPALAIGTVVSAAESVFADEGVETPEGFLDCGAIGFPLGPPPVRGPAVPADATVRRWLAGAGAREARIATVSACSGTDAQARRVAARAEAWGGAEAMEGAAVALVAARLGVAAGELRCISNTTGDRPRQVWDVPAALAALSRAVGRLAAPAGRP